MIRRDKHELVLQLRELIQTELSTLGKALSAAREAATHEESKPENKYDTFGLEASYLAGAQKERLDELKATLHMLDQMQLSSFSPSDPIKPGALVELEANGVSSLCLLLILGPGYSLSFGTGTVLTVTTHSPLGRALLGKTVGDFVSIKTQNSTKNYEILNLE
ncbi:MAG: GreA/GreB family elongation factor [Proteobacteria bacterium]|nr:GreA/GreB family elongation factor [Pseudomonadota bacterium]